MYHGKIGISYYTSFKNTWFRGTVDAYPERLFDGVAIEITNSADITGSYRMLSRELTDGDPVEVRNQRGAVASN